ncbi:MAG: proton-conducting transporter membrane subunit [Candidatus Altiarchaeota archaeon]|nr:proton-conducting transporter membrane subunit [Candidatus Altiarchaeota archaeon]
MLSFLFYASLALLLLGSAWPLVFGRLGGRVSRSMSFLFAVAGSVLMFAFSALVLYGNLGLRLPGFGMLPGFGLSFFVDRLSAFFMLAISFVSGCVGVYSIAYAEHGVHEKRKSVLASLLSVFVLSMILVVASDNTFSFMFFWEAMSLASFLLVVYDYEKPESRRAGIFYFVMTQLSTVFLLAAFLMLYGHSGSFAIQPMPYLSSRVMTVVFLLLFAGFGVKAGVIPFHKWLPYAHPASPSNISALMSGVMIKVAVYGLMRFVLDVLAPDSWWGTFILLAGTVSAFLGVIYALKEHDIKRLLAYHSIENIGIILIGFGACILFRSYGLPEIAFLALAGSLFHVLNHAVFKSLLFLTAGSVVEAAKTRNIEEMGGLARRMPYTALFFLVGSVSISALPPFNGFASELLIFQALLQSYLIGSKVIQLVMMLCLSAFALTSALAAACFVKAFGITFLAAPRSECAKKAVEAPLPMLAGPLVLALSCALLGLFSPQLFALAGFNVPMPDMLVIGLLMLASFAVVYLFVRVFSNNASRVAETWGCGILSQDSRMEYTASGFSEPVVTIFKPIYHTKKESHNLFYDLHKVIFRSGRGEIKLMRFFEEYLYLPVARLGELVSKAFNRLENGSLDSYIAYSFIAVVLFIVILGWYA